MSEAYFSFGASLAAQTNIETYTLFPPDFLPDRGGMPVALMGGDSKQLLSGRVIRNGFLNGAMVLDVFQDGHDTLNTLLYAMFGGLTVASKKWYFIAPDSSGHYSPFYGYIGNPYLGQTAKEGVNGIPFDLVFSLTACVKQSVTKSSNTTLTSSERLVYADTSGGNVTLTLCAASAINANTIVRIIKTSASNTLTIQRGGSDTVNGGTTALTVTAIYGEKTLSSDHVSAWITI